MTRVDREIEARRLSKREPESRPKNGQGAGGARRRAKDSPVMRRLPQGREESPKDYLPGARR